MRPVALRYSGHKGYQLVHLCLGCGKRSLNRVALDTVQSDDWDSLCRLPADD